MMWWFDPFGACWVSPRGWNFIFHFLVSNLLFLESIRFDLFCTILLIYFHRFYNLLFILFLSILEPGSRNLKTFFLNINKLPRNLDIFNFFLHGHIILSFEVYFCSRTDGTLLPLNFGHKHIIGQSNGLRLVRLYKIWTIVLAFFIWWKPITFCQKCPWYRSVLHEVSYTFVL